MNQRPLRASVKLLAATTFFSVSLANLALAGPKVVTTIKPLHSLVSSVMGNVGEPYLLLKGSSSPHEYALKPSDASHLQEADLVFWIGPSLESFIEKPIETIAAKTEAVELIETPGLTLYKFRGDHHHDHGHHANHEEEHDHEASAHDDHGHEKHAENEHDHEEHAGHDEHDHEEHAENTDHHKGDIDPHIWLDPVNAKIMVTMIENELIENDPAHADTYKKNAAATRDNLDKLIKDVKGIFSAKIHANYVVFHDAYQYFDRRFGLNPPLGSIHVSPEVEPGAKRIHEIRENIQTKGASCIFSEPQFNPKLIATISEGLRLTNGTLDPLGAEIKDGPDLYPNLIKNMANAMQPCFAAS